MFSVHTAPEEFENEGFTLKTHQMFSVHTTAKEFRNVTTTGHIELVFEENSVIEYHDYRNNVTVYEKHLFQIVFSRHRKAKLAFSNSSGLQSVFGKLCFRDRLVWTEGVTEEIKLCFRDRLVWTEGVTEEIKLCFRDRLVWTELRRNPRNKALFS